TKSKRITCHKRYKILKKVYGSHISKRLDQGTSPKGKDPGVPNSLPFKEEVLKHVQEMKVVSSEVRTFNLLNAGKIQEAESKRLSSFAPYHLETDKIIMESNVVLEVLDARDPLGTRSSEIEDKVMSANKRLVLILNKMGS
ncbi:nuclear GTP-binding protein, partial [Paragonimus westermani]